MKRISISCLIVLLIVASPLSGCFPPQHGPKLPYRIESSYVVNRELQPHPDDLDKSEILLNLSDAGVLRIIAFLRGELYVEMLLSAREECLVVSDSFRMQALEGPMLESPSLSMPFLGLYRGTDEQYGELIREDFVSIGRDIVPLAAVFKGEESEHLLLEFEVMVDGMHIPCGILFVRYDR